MLKKFTTLHLTLKGGFCSVLISHQLDRELPNGKVPVFITQSLLRGRISAEGISKADPAEGGWPDSAHTFFVRGNFVCHQTPQRFQQAAAGQACTWGGNGEKGPQRQDVNWQPLPIRATWILCSLGSTLCHRDAGGSSSMNLSGSRGHVHDPLSSLGAVFQEVENRDLESLVYSFSKGCHNKGPQTEQLKQQKFTVSQFWVQKSEIKVSTG